MKDFVKLSWSNHILQRLGPPPPPPFLLFGLTGCCHGLSAAASWLLCCAVFGARLALTSSRRCSISVFRCLRFFDTRLMLCRTLPVIMKKQEFLRENYEISWKIPQKVMFRFFGRFSKSHCKRSFHFNTISNQLVRSVLNIQGGSAKCHKNCSKWSKMTLFDPKMTWNDLFWPKNWYFCPENDNLEKSSCTRELLDQNRRWSPANKNYPPTGQPAPAFRKSHTRWSYNTVSLVWLGWQWCFLNLWCTNTILWFWKRVRGVSSDFWTCNFFE